MGNRRLSFAILIVGLLGPLLACPSYAGCGRMLHVAYFDWTRFTVGQSESLGFDLDKDLLGPIMARAGCTFEIRPMPSNRLLMSLKHGTVDAAVGASITPERQEYAYFSVAYRPERIVLFMLADQVANAKISSLEDLLKGGHRVGGSIGAWYGEDFARFSAANPDFERRLLRTDDSAVMFGWLVQGRADIVINDLYYSVHFLKQHPEFTQVRPYPFILADEDVYLMFAKALADEIDLPAINAAITEFRAMPAYQAILDRYTKLE